MNLKRMIRYFLKNGNKLKEVEIRKNDVYLVSFPKSGNTWMRFLLIHSIFNKKKRV